MINLPRANDQYRFQVERLKTNNGPHEWVEWISTDSLFEAIRELIKFGRIYNTTGYSKLRITFNPRIGQHELAKAL